MLLFLIGCNDYAFAPKTEHELEDSGVCELAANTWEVATDAACEVEPVIGNFQPSVEWQWTTNAGWAGYDDIMATPSVANITDDNGDGAINDLDIPDILFGAFASAAYTSAGTLTAISGDGSGEIWSLFDAGGYHFYSCGTPAIGDIDGDGLPEICMAGVEAAVVCVNADGSFKWAAGAEVYPYGAPALADMDADGRSEVVFGRQIFDFMGNQIGIGAGGFGWALSFPVDLNDDGRLELVAGNTAYGIDGTLIWTDGTPDGPGAVGDFDLDGLPEVVHVSGGYVYLTAGNGTSLWAVAVPGGGGGPPTVADFDDDGWPEIGVAGAYYYVVFDTDGTVLWQAGVQDYSSSVTGSSVFDFEGDGRSDVVYADEVTLWVYDGATGAVKFQLDDHASGTLYEYPLIVDVDADGATEMVIASNDYTFDGWNGITVIGDANNTWRPSRPVWNQYAYHITNVENDGSIPTNQEANWLRWNNFRAGGTELGLGSALADLSPTDPTYCTTCDEALVQLMVPIQNTGLADTLEFSVLLERMDGTLVSSATLSLAAGAATDVGPFTVTREDWRAGLRVSVDPDNVIEECDEEDNTLELGDWPCNE